MVSLVSLADVKAMLGVDGDDHDSQLTNIYIPGASNLVIRYLKDQAEAVLDLDSGGDLPSGAEVPPQIMVATIALIDEWYYENPDKTTKMIAGGDLPQRVRDILSLYRDPALA